MYIYLHNGEMHGLCFAMQERKLSKYYYISLNRCCKLFLPASNSCVNYLTWLSAGGSIPPGKYLLVLLSLLRIPQLNSVQTECLYE